MCIKRTMLQALRGIYADPDILVGICQNLEDRMSGDIYEVEMRRMFESWPLYSGSTTFPVEGNISAYLSNLENHSLWDKETLNGAMRWNLLEHCIKTLEEELAGPSLLQRIIRWLA